MTKYIRTKDGAIYKIEDNNLIFNGNKIPVDINKIEKDYKVADTIEELCDCFIDLMPKYKGNDIIGYEHDFWYYSKEEKCFYNMIDNQSLDLKDFDTDFKGAIWTDKGLIYVSQVEDEEMVLI